MARIPQWTTASSLSRLHDYTQTHHSRYDSSGQVIGPTQRLLPVYTQHSQKTGIHAPGGIRTRNPSQRAAADIRLRQLGHWDRHLYLSLHEIKLRCLSLISRHRCFSRRGIWNVQVGRSLRYNLSLYRLRNVTHDVIMATSRTLCASFPALRNECRTQALQGLECYVECGNYYVIFM